MIIVSNERSFKIHLFLERKDTKSYRIGMRSEPSSSTENDIGFEMDWPGKILDFELAWYVAGIHNPIYIRQSSSTVLINIPEQKKK